MDKRAVAQVKDGGNVRVGQKCLLVAPHLAKHAVGKIEHRVCKGPELVDLVREREKVGYAVARHENDHHDEEEEHLVGRVLDRVQDEAEVLALSRVLEELERREDDVECHQPVNHRLHLSDDHDIVKVGGVWGGDEECEGEEGMRSVRGRRG